MMRKKINILITSAGRRCQLIDCFRKDAQELDVHSRIFAVDLNSKMSSACHYADTAFDVCRCTEPNYIDEIMSICNNNEIQLIIPTIDTELHVFSLAKKQFKDSGINVAISNSQIIELCRNKFFTAQALEKIGVNVPRSMILSADSAMRSQLSFPQILKPIDGSCSIGIQKLNTQSDTPIKQNPDRWLLQEFISGKEYTVNAFVNTQGKLVSAIPHLRNEIRAGEVSKGITCKIPELQTIAETIVNSIHGFYGAFCFQAIQNEKNEFYVFEINARFGGGYPLAHYAGGTFSKWLIEETLHLPSSEHSLWADNVTMLRYDQALFLK